MLLETQYTHSTAQVRSQTGREQRAGNISVF
jgi:hypothetical protein